VLELEQVSKQYPAPDGGAIRAVDGVSLTLAAGELIALYGPSGSGKSTFLLLAGGVTAPDAGSVRFDDRDLATLSRRELTRHRRTELGFVFQLPRLVPGMTAIDNAALKLMVDGMRRNEARRRVMPLLERLGLGTRAEHPAAQLSYGERQRVGIARALSNGPRLVLADEPTGGLDSRRGHEVLALLAEVCRSRAVGVLLATHDPAAAEHADRVCTLRDGRLIPDDPDAAPATVTAPPGSARRR
jgi:putative ABC transport system ATP-binding protein